MTRQALIAVMKRTLQQFNDEGVTISNSTIHNEVLADDDGPTSSASSKRLYRGLIRWVLAMNGAGDPTWPSNWMDMSVADLAAVLIP